MTSFEEYIIDSIRILLSNVLKVNADIRLSTPYYIRFQPHFLYGILFRLQKMGLIDENDDLKRNLLLLFEFSTRHGFVTFDFKINWKNEGILYSEAARQKVFEICKKHPHIFTRVLENDGKLKEKWHAAFQKKILTKKEFSFYEQNRDENVSDLLECRFRKIVDRDLPMIEDVLYKELK